MQRIWIHLGGDAQQANELLSKLIDAGLSGLVEQAGGGSVHLSVTADAATCRSLLERRSGFGDEVSIDFEKVIFVSPPAQPPGHPAYAERLRVYSLHLLR